MMAREYQNAETLATLACTLTITLSCIQDGIGYLRLAVTRCVNNHRPPVHKTSKFMLSPLLSVSIDVTVEHCHY
ncbi:hypothetical protein HYPSUDRAFT_90204 [Hypholoma sublateritium FD-334 SS-4]|uniref:Uncharacterized protein n=1 Tax=Hypholoma sublateritium (strain FD-334 SS-4) TaxID=945553 RepID=A0A0D2M510_HYPSF|nr:hypothetical protein HYPSUDRAFT_90204 [Hypholoma sublateritium FD-334 SS-4]